MDALENIGVVILVINSNYQTVLLGERINSYKAGHYGLPGGRIELSESLVGAASRELFEETGITINTSELEYLGVVREFQETYNFIHFAFVLENPTQAPQNTEPNKCNGWEWISIEKFPENILRGHKEAIEMYVSNKPMIDISS